MLDGIKSRGLAVTNLGHLANLTAGAACDHVCPRSKRSKLDLSVVWIDATGGGASADRTGSDPKGLLPLGLHWMGSGSTGGKACFPHGVRRRPRGLTEGIPSTEPAHGNDL